MGINLFLITPVDSSRRWLRRYSRSNDCPGKFKYHNNRVTIGAGPALESKCWGKQVDETARDDSRWPEFCEYCAYRFSPNDHWQETLQREFAMPDGSRITLDEAPAGALWFADWPVTSSKFHIARGGGPHLFLRTPGGDWDIDTPSRDGEGWERTGEVPKISVKPSIICNNYHGVVSNGVLEEV